MAKRICEACCRNQPRNRLRTSREDLRARRRSPTNITSLDSTGEEDLPPAHIGQPNPAWIEAWQAFLVKDNNFSRRHHVVLTAHPKTGKTPTARGRLEFHRFTKDTVTHDNRQLPQIPIKALSKLLLTLPVTHSPQEVRGLLMPT